jgi:ribonuclease P protein component
MRKQGFPKAIRIKKKPEFDQIIRQGKKTVGINLVLYRLNSKEKEQKFGIKVSRNIKGAVKRNKIKRVLREIIRKNKERFKENERVLLLYRSRTVNMNYQDLLLEFENLVG